MRPEDNWTWRTLYERVNRLKDDNDTLVSDIYYDSSEYRYINVLIKLGYIEKIFLFSGYILYGHYKRLKEIPSDLTWKEAQELAKPIKIKKNSRKKSMWNFVVENVNTQQFAFNKHVVFPDINMINNVNIYLNKLCRLDYIEKVDKVGNYNILKRIPDTLTVTLADKYLTDVIYIRQRKILQIKEKMLNDNDRGI